MIHKFSFCFLACLAFAFHGFSQNEYIESVYDSVIVQTFTYATKQGQNLDLDYYSPFSLSDTKRPLVIYVHGGGFSSGTRNSPKIVDFCNKLAQYGYNVASISYRLTRMGKPEGFGCDCPATEKMNTFQSAVEDLQDATFFLIENRESLAIDPQKIILAGSSAGAETVLNTAYQPPMCYGLDSGPVSYAGVISMAGAIPDTLRIYNESAVPSLLFHGTCDNLVPFSSASHRHCQPDQQGYLPLFGSLSIAQRLRTLQVPHWLYISCGAGHEIASDPMTSSFGVMVAFCYEYVVLGKGSIRQTIIPGDQRSCTYGNFDFCDL
jgi:acetyl esterase/lipase